MIEQIEQIIKYMVYAGVFAGIVVIVHYIGTIVMDLLYDKRYKSIFKDQGEPPEEN